MVRVNLINPRNLMDQHLVAEYNEILMLLGHVRNSVKLETIPRNYTLGRGHINFFKNKLLYLKKRHEFLKEEMKTRGFKPSKRINLEEFPGYLVNDWVPDYHDKRLIKSRLIEKVEKKPWYYTYYGEKKSLSFYKELIENG